MECHRPGGHRSVTVCVEIDAGARLAANSTDTSTHFVRKHGQARRFRSVPELSEEDSLDANDPLVLQSVVRHNSLPDSRDLDRLQWREAFVSSGSHSYFSTSAINVRRRASFSAQLECFPAIESRTGNLALRSWDGRTQAEKRSPGATLTWKGDLAGNASQIDLEHRGCPAAV